MGPPTPGTVSFCDASHGQTCCFPMAPFSPIPLPSPEENVSPSHWVARHLATGTFHVALLAALHRHHQASQLWRKRRTPRCTLRTGAGRDPVKEGTRERKLSHLPKWSEPMTCWGIMETNDILPFSVTHWLTQRNRSYLNASFLTVSFSKMPGLQAG